MPAAVQAQVKTEVVEDVEDQPDFGGEEEPQAEPQADPQAKTEAGGDVEMKVAGVAKKEELDEKAKGEPRADALHLSGVNRLTRTHLAEVFASKRLPAFQRVEWIADDKCVVVFANKQAAAESLNAALDGFEEGRDKPGPGLWRAIRGYMDFRQATVLDVPSANFKKQHRAGRQVRDYRFWEAAKDIDKSIMEGLEQKGIKRDAPSGEDAIAAAVYANQLGEAPRKKRRKMPAGEGDLDEPEPEAPELLEQMAQKDKELLGLKAEVEESPAPVAETGENEAVAAVCEVVAQEKWEDSWFAQQAKNAGRRTGEEAWGRHAQADDLEPREDAGPTGSRRDVRDAPRRRGRDQDWRHDQFQDMDRPRVSRAWGHDDRAGAPSEVPGPAPRKRGRGDGNPADDWGTNRGGNARRDAPQKPLVWEADDEEKRKRVKRMDRFSKAAPAAATDTAGDAVGDAAGAVDDAGDAAGEAGEH
mmetsp:Transcript_34835/g.75195  ORF Transcript_34835/g.75195 Transcript_34835/m.75195 type:complete len:472 (-) Transcript_34835:33-1448(-)